MYGAPSYGYPAPTAPSNHYGGYGSSIAMNSSYLGDPNSSFQQPQQPQGAAPPPALVEEVGRLRGTNERLQDTNAALQAEIERLRSQLRQAEGELQRSNEQNQQLQIAVQQERALAHNEMRKLSEHSQRTHAELGQQAGELPVLEGHLMQSEQHRLYLEGQLREAVAREQTLSTELNRLTDAEMHRVEEINNMKREFERQRAQLEKELANEQEASRRDRKLRDDAETRAVKAENQLRLASDTVSVRVTSDAIEAQAREAEIARLGELSRQHHQLGLLLAQADAAWSDMDHSWVATLSDTTPSATVYQQPPPPVAPAIGYGAATTIPPHLLAGHTTVPPPISSAPIYGSTLANSSVASAYPHLSQQQQTTQPNPYYQQPLVNSAYRPYR